MRIIVCGGRDFDDWARLDEVLTYTQLMAKGEPIYIVQGGAKGADFLAKVWAKYKQPSCNIYQEEYPADWNKYGKSAGYIRNNQMLKEGRPDLVIAFPGGRGTDSMVKLAREAGVEVKRA